MLRLCAIGMIVGAVLGAIVALGLGLAFPGDETVSGGPFGWSIGGLLIGIAEGGGFGALIGALWHGVERTR